MTTKLSMTKRNERNPMALSTRISRHQSKTRLGSSSSVLFSLRSNFTDKLHTFLLASLFLVAPLVGCKDNSNSSKSKAIIGADDRVEIQDQQLLNKLGLLNVGDHNCNASLISPDTIVTVVHCLNSDKLNSIEGFTFSSASGKIARVNKLITLDTKKDLAIYKLDASNFDHVNVRMQSSLGSKISVAGYDVTKGKWLISECQIASKSTETTSFTYTCDTVPGMSGSAVLSEGYLVGLHVAHDKALNQNLGLDFASVNNQSADLSKRPQVNLEWPPCICCHGCDVPKISIPSLDEYKDGMLKQLNAAVNGPVADQAKKSSWSYGQCNTNATALVVAITTPLYGTICSAVGLATAGTGVPPCLAWIGGVTGLVVGSACIQACVDGKITVGCPQS